MRIALPALLVRALILAAVALSLFSAASPSRAEEAERGVEKIGPHLYRVGTVLLNAEERTVHCSGVVNMAEGAPIELLACTPRGKTHESVFTLDVRPLDLQVALLLLGLRDGRNPAYHYPADSADGAKATADTARIFVEWSAGEGGGEKSGEQEPPEGGDAGEETVRAPAEAFLYNIPEERPERAASWSFLGSRWVGERFGAEVDGSLITTYHDPLAILELALPTVNDDVYYSVNTEICPPVGTEV
ncbi:MAG: YdjY domain-containing protein, partial [Candidatus Brocadiaceae bacterium]